MRFGIAKRKYDFNRIMAKLKETTPSIISMVFIMMNVDTLLRLRHLIVVFVCMSLSDLQKGIQSLSLAHERENDYVFS